MRTPIVMSSTEPTWIGFISIYFRTITEFLIRCQILLNINIALNVSTSRVLQYYEVKSFSEFSLFIVFQVVPQSLATLSVISVCANICQHYIPSGPLYSILPLGIKFNRIESRMWANKGKCVINFHKHLYSHIQRRACKLVFMPKWLSAIDFCFIRASLACFITFNRNKIDELTIKERPINSVHIYCMYICTKVCMNIMPESHWSHI